jgi:hypothetical protein
MTLLGDAAHPMLPSFSRNGRAWTACLAAFSPPVSRAARQREPASSRGQICAARPAPC